MKESELLYEPIKERIFENEIPTQSISYWGSVWKGLYNNKAALISLVIITFLIVCAIAIPFITHNTYYDTHLSLKNQVPSRNYWFGTDELGRDVFIRIWWGARISLFVGFTAAIIDMIIGVSYGAFAGMMEGEIEEVMMRIADILYSLPHLIIVILLMVILNSGLFTVILALTFTGWINMARIVRSQILQIKKNDYVLSAKMLGASKLRILLKHLIPNALGTIITTMTLTIPVAIFTETFLSFLGLGVQAPVASWGTMACDGLSALRYYPWRLLFPAIFISVTMLSLNLLGDGIRDAFDPRMRT